MICEKHICIKMITCAELGCAQLSFYFEKHGITVGLNNRLIKDFVLISIK